MPFPYPKIIVAGGARRPSLSNDVTHRQTNKDTAPCRVLTVGNR